MKQAVLVLILSVSFVMQGWTQARADLITGSTWPNKTYQQKRDLYAGFLYGFLFAKQLTEIADKKTNNTTASGFLKQVVYGFLDADAAVVIALVDAFYRDPLNKDKMLNEAMSDAFIKEEATRKGK